MNLDGTNKVAKVRKLFATLLCEEWNDDQVASPCGCHVVTTMAAGKAEKDHDSEE